MNYNLPRLPQAHTLKEALLSKGRMQTQHRMLHQAYLSGRQYVRKEAEHSSTVYACCFQNLRGRTLEICSPFSFLLHLSWCAHIS